MSFPSLKMGPGKSSRSHTADEFIFIQEIEEAIELYLESSAGKILIFKDGMAADYSEEEATRILSCSEVTALVDMKMGEAKATAWGCDLTYDYVKINADYRS